VSHARQGPPARGPFSRLPTGAVAALAALLAVVAGVVLTLQLGGSGQGSDAAGTAHPSPRAPAARRHPPDTPSSTPVPSASRGAVPHRDPFGPSAAALAASSPGPVLAAVYDVSTGQTWTLGRGRPQDEASIVKVDILETLLARYRTAGSALPAAYFPTAQEMIEYSDNDAATTLWYAAGGPARIRSYNAAAGLHHTSPSRCVDCAGFPWPGWGLTTTTPGDQIALLRQLIKPSPLLTGDQRRYILRLMERVTPSQRWGVSDGVPRGATVALKNGWLPLTSTDDDWQVNSIGWVCGAGRDYLLAVLTTGNPTEQDGIDTIGRLAASIWRTMR
jgi:beta-lactamase class A